MNVTIINYGQNAQPYHCQNYNKIKNIICDADSSLIQRPKRCFGVTSNYTFSHVWYFKFSYCFPSKKKRSTTAFSFLLIYLPLFSFTNQEEMAEAIPFGIARKIIELLGSATFKEIGSIWGTGVKDDTEKFKNTVSSIQAV